MSEGMRVAPRWKGTRIGHITDIACFVPGEEPEVDGDDAGPADRAGRADGLPRLDHLPEPGAADGRPRDREASREHRLLGMRCPVCARVYVGGDRPYCPIDSIEFGPRPRSISRTRARSPTSWS